jgi:hypothetical protein
MIYKLELEHKTTNKDDVAYAVAELRKAKETLNELCKDKEKYKDKIRILAQHIHNVRKNAKLREYYDAKLIRKKDNMYREFDFHEYSELHENLKEHRRSMVNAVKIQRRQNKEIAKQWKEFGIKKYAKIGSKKMGYVHFKAGTILELLKSKKIKTIKDAKKPFNSSNHIGVEIEFASYLNESQIGQLFYDAGLIEYVQLGHEFVQGRDDGENEFELCVVAPQEKIYEIIERVCVILNEKADANITYGCGLHVHIDARNRNIKTMFDNLYNCQEILYDMVSYKRRSNKHVKLMPTKLWYPAKNGFRHGPECKDTVCKCEFQNTEHFKKCAERYYGLNTWSYKSHQTMEIRIHSGTSNATKINNWIKLLLTIVDGKPVKTYVRSIDDFKNYVKLDEKLMGYVEKRIENFKVS